MASTLGQRICWSLVLLSVLYVSGILIFVRFERGAELQMYEDNRILYTSMKDLYSFHHCEDEAFQNLSFCKNQANFGETLRVYFNQHTNSMEDLEQWTTLGTMFYITHLSTTIGYGSSHPNTPMGQLATVFFALFGIPIMGFTLAQVAQLNLKFAVFVLEKGSGKRVDTVRQQIGLLWCLLVIYIVVGAGVYSYLEPWTFLQALYFCFVTLSTVGFGDFLPSSPVSKAFSIFYMIAGLGVCASIIAVLTGLVSEAHDKSDMFLTEKIQEHCPECLAADDCCLGQRAP